MLSSHLSLGYCFSAMHGRRIDRYNCIHSPLLLFYPSQQMLVRCLLEEYGCDTLKLKKMKQPKTKVPLFSIYLVGVPSTSCVLPPPPRFLIHTNMYILE